MKDFRQFKGENHEVHFSTDPKNNITVIMGENGTGKTTIAQAFTWCLYGTTTFANKELLCRSRAVEMSVGEAESVRVTITLVHSDIEYTIDRSQKYTKQPDDSCKSSHTKPVISYKTLGGQSKELLTDTEIDTALKTILPSELSKYFFFDGERIEKMSKDIRNGKSAEFAGAVRNILGLDTLTSALDHLKGKGNRSSLLRTYNESYHSNSQEEMDGYNKKIKDLESEIISIDSDLNEKNIEIDALDERRLELREKIKTFDNVKEYARQRDKCEEKIASLENSKKDNIKEVIKTFQQGNSSFFMEHLMKEALDDLEKADKTDKGIPDIHKRAIDFLVERGICLCGTCVPPDSAELKQLLSNLDFIAPQAIGTLIDTYTQVSKVKISLADNCFPAIVSRYAQIRSFQGDYDELQVQLEEVNKHLENTENVAIYQKELHSKEKNIKKFQGDIAVLNQRKGNIEPQITALEGKRAELALQDDSNKKIEVYKAYVEYIAQSLTTYYDEKEQNVREDLEKNINEIFHKIYAGGFSLSVDKEYNVILESTQFSGNHNDVETSTAQSISVIFSFIAGVIKMAREAHDSNDDDLNTEPYPLVMDAPLSSFDKARIKTVCDVLPSVAEQVVIFIKDTDGELAEQHMDGKIGKRYVFEKVNEFETKILERGGK